MGYRPAKSCIGHIVDETLPRHLRYRAKVQNKSFILIVLTLVLLIAIALWQFYSLAWADGSSFSYHARAPSVASAPR